MPRIERGERCKQRLPLLQLNRCVSEGSTSPALQARGDLSNDRRTFSTLSRLALRSPTDSATFSPHSPSFLLGPSSYLPRFEGIPEPLPFLLSGDANVEAANTSA